MMSRFIRILALILVLALCAGLLAGCGAKKVGEFKVEKNTDGYRPEVYPFVVRTSSSVWYLSQEDIDAMGEEAFYAGLESVLKDMEADFADARAVLAPWLNEEIPPVVICTDFGGKAEISENAGAYYNGQAGFIKVFDDWTMVKAALLHEYVHYLSMSCMPSRTWAGFWAEGLAEYLSRMVCANRMSHSVNMGLNEEAVALYTSRGAWDEERGSIDEGYLYYGTAEVVRSGLALGQPYFTVSSEMRTYTEVIREHPAPETLSYYEAASIFAYLVETYGWDAVAAQWNSDPRYMQELCGKDFAEVYADWGVWSEARCAELGIDIYA